MNLKYYINIREKVYFFLLATISFSIYASLITLVLYPGLSQLIGIKSSTILTYLIYLIILVSIGELSLVGMVRGNAVKASKVQFPELFELVNAQSKLLGLNKVPSVYIMQQGGVINAFAFRFMRKRHVVLFAPVLEEAYKEGKDVLAFIVGHELGHIKRNHVGILKTLFILPGILFFPLYLAYSRACEYTCDSIGYALSPSGAVKGMSLLAVGPMLYAKLNTKDWLANGAQDRGFATWFNESFSTHPHLVQRVKALNAIKEQENHTS